MRMPEHVVKFVKEVLPELVIWTSGVAVYKTPKYGQVCIGEDMYITNAEDLRTLATAIAFNADCRARLTWLLEGYDEHNSKASSLHASRP